jgi:Uma2 family endonuclease
MVLQDTLLTVDSFVEIISRPEYDGKRAELHEGVIVEMPPSDQSNVFLEAHLIFILLRHVLPNDLGKVTTPDAGYKIGTKSYLQPDVAFLTKAQVQTHGRGVFPFAPALAIEVISPSETTRSIANKARLYLQAGTVVVWVVYPDERIFDAYRMGEDGALSVRSYGIDDTLTAEDVLPGFTLSLREVFKILDSPSPAADHTSGIST